MAQAVNLVLQGLGDTHAEERVERGFWWSWRPAPGAFRFFFHDASLADLMFNKNRLRPRTDKHPTEDKQAWGWGAWPESQSEAA